MKQIIDVDIDFVRNEIIFIGRGTKLIKNLTEFLATNFDSTELLNEKLKFSYNSIQNIKRRILEDIRQLTQNMGSTESFKKAFTLLDNKNIKEELIKELFKEDASLGFLRDCAYLDQKTSIKNELFFKRYFGKEDYDFSGFSQLDDFNKMIEMFNSNMYDTLLCLEINNLQAVNHLCGDDMGDEILQTFTNELTSVFDETLMIRYGGDEFIIFTNLETADEIQRIVNGEDFLNILNNCLPVLKTDDGIDVFCTVSIGTSKIDVPIRVYSRDDIIQFKKMVNLSYYDAQKILSVNKQSIKEKYNHLMLKDTYKDTDGIIDYRAYLLDKENNKNVDEFIEYSGEINIDNLLKTHKGLKS